MLRAHALNMTDGHYQFLYVDTELADESKIRMINSKQLWYRDGDPDNNATRQAFENVLYVSRTYWWRVPKWWHMILNSVRNELAEMSLIHFPAI